LSETDRARLRRIADELMREHPEATLAGASDLEPLNWVEESNALARRLAYTEVREGETPSPAYTEQVRRTSRQRLALAGYRLAGLLNQLFVAPPPQPSDGAAPR
jgi:hypothetical protein